MKNFQVLFLTLALAFGSTQLQSVAQTGGQAPATLEAASKKWITKVTVKVRVKEGVPELGVEVVKTGKCRKGKGSC